MKKVLLAALATMLLGSPVQAAGSLLGLLGCYKYVGSGNGSGCSGGIPAAPAVQPRAQAPSWVPVPQASPMPAPKPVPAGLVVELPADAKLWLNGTLMKTNSGRRVFAVPALAPGRAYYYDVRAEIVRGGQAHVQTRRVLLYPGYESREVFEDLAPPMTTVPAVYYQAPGR